MKESAKILLLGRTGSGKSAFINYFLGEKVAASACGKPVTQEYFTPYECLDGQYPIEFFDTPGLDASIVDGQVDRIANEVRMRNSGYDVFEWFHTIFYCISMAEMRFEDYEAQLCNRLRHDLQHHIHIILTHCDCASEQDVASMREMIQRKLGDVDYVEIFEVTSVHKVKRNGQVVEPTGRQAISERVFDLLVEDLSDRFAHEYAQDMLMALNQSLDDSFAKLQRFVSKNIRPGRVIREISRGDTESSDSIMSRLDQELQSMEEALLRTDQQATARANEILKPAARLYASYSQTILDIDGAYVANDTRLCFTDVQSRFAHYQTPDTDVLVKRTVPRLSREMEKGLEISEDMVSKHPVRFIIYGILDILMLRRHFKSALRFFENELKQQLPSNETLIADARWRIAKYLRSELLPLFHIRDYFKA